MKFEAVAIVTLLVIANATGEQTATIKTPAPQAHTNKITALFERLDTDKNGVLSKQEFVEGQKKLQQIRSTRNKQKAGPAKSVSSGDLVGTEKKYDLNHDGKLSREEKLAMIRDHNSSRGAEE